MKLQILVPQYKETDEIIKPLLDSIALQQNVDFDEVGVIIVNDGTDVYLSSKLLDSYPYEIEYYIGPHRGVSGARNDCLMLATADYVMFCDADDMFCNVCGLYLIFRYIEEGFDTLTSLFYEETKGKDGKPLYVKHDRDVTFVHGKVHRREFLEENSIWWDENLTIHEDGYFNVLCYYIAEDKKYCEDAFYLWKWREGSICRRDKEYALSTFTDYIKSNDATVKELVRRGLIEEAMYILAHFVFEVYYTMNEPNWINHNNSAYRDKVAICFAEHFNKWKHLWDAIPSYQKLPISEETRKEAVKKGMLMEKVTLNEWFAQIKEKQYVNEKTETEAHGDA